MRIRKWIADAWCRMLGFLIGEVLPVLSFGSVVSFRQQATVLKLTVFGYGAVFVLGLLLLHKWKKRVHAMPHGIKRGLLLGMFTALFWFAGFGIFLFSVHMANKLYRWWIFVGVCFLVGRIFLLFDECKRSEE